MIGRALVLGTAIFVLGVPALAQDAGMLAGRGKTLFIEKGCYGCHMVGKIGTEIGPNLSRVGLKYSETYLRGWLRDPALQKPGAHMPKLELSEAEIRALAAYLVSLE